MTVIEKLNECIEQLANIRVSTMDADNVGVPIKRVTIDLIACRNALLAPTQEPEKAQEAEGTKSEKEATHASEAEQEVVNAQNGDDEQGENVPG